MHAKTFMQDPGSPRRVRRWIADVLPGCDGDAVARVQLLASELVTNSLVHARSDVGVTITRSDARVSVEVQDASDAAPVRRSVPLDSTTGRGIWLVDTLSDEWGVRVADHAKTVWFELDL